MKLNRALTVVAATVATLIASISISHAQTVDPVVPPPATTISYEMPMKPIGFDPATAAKYGCPTVRPLGAVSGDCGTSYLYLDGIEPNGVRLRTGFRELHRPAVSYSWAADVYGPSGFRKTAGGFLNQAYKWEGVWNVTNLAKGKYSGLVTSPSWALMTDGTICSAGAPTDIQIVD